MNPSHETASERSVQKSETKNLDLKNKTNFETESDQQVSATIRVPPEVAYLFFRDLQNLPLFMKDIKSVQIITDTQSRWTIEAKGLKAEWTSEIIEETPGEYLSWKSLDGSEVETQGSIRFEPAPENQGTTVILSLNYKVPGGKLTELFMKTSGEDPRSLAYTNLRRLKCLLETGEIATIQGQSTGRDKESYLIDKV